MITVQIRRHKYPYGRKYNPQEDRLVGEFTSLKQMLKAYKTLGCGAVTHYCVALDQGIPPILLNPVTKHFKAVGETKA